MGVTATPTSHWGGTGSSLNPYVSNLTSCECISCNQEAPALDPSTVTWVTQLELQAGSRPGCGGHLWSEPANEDLSLFLALKSENKSLNNGSTPGAQGGYTRGGSHSGKTRIMEAPHGPRGRGCSHLHVIHGAQRGRGAHMRL